MPAVALLSLFAALAGCGSEETDTAADPVAKPRQVQELLSAEAWQAALADDTELAARASATGLAWQAAGKIEGGAGKTLIWGEYAAGPNAAREAVVAVFRICDKANTCVHGQGNHSANDAVLADAQGNAITQVDIGAVVFGKRLLEHNLQKAHTVLVGAALSRNDPVDALATVASMAQVAFGKRRLVLLSAYGPAVGFGLEKLSAAGAKGGLFDSVETIHFARRQDLVRILPQLTPLDVVVWVGAGVIDTFTDGKPDKSVGMTLSRGVLGDELIHRDAVKGVLDQPPLGGPGLIILAGSDSLTAEHATQTGLLAQALQEVPWRPVVGFDGQVDAAGVEGAVAALLEAIAVGKTLDEAISAGSAKAGKATLRTLLDPALAEAWHFPGPSATFWAKPPGKAQLKLYVKVTPKCVEAATTCDLAAFKAGKAIDSKNLTASAAIFECPLTFNGPFFECASKNDVTSADFRIRGLLRGLTVAEGVFLLAEGSPSKKVRNIKVLGAGAIEASDLGGGSQTLRFGGPAAASPYVDADGYCCIAVTPLLSGQQSNQLSTLVITP